MATRNRPAGFAKGVEISKGHYKLVGPHGTQRLTTDEPSFAGDDEAAAAGAAAAADWPELLKRLGE